MAPKRPATWLIASDALAILIFVTIGLAEHHRGISVRGYARDALPLFAGWYAAAVAFRMYQTHRPGRVLATWIVGVPVGVLIRALALGRTLNGKEASFLVVALLSILVLVFLLRALLSLTPPR
jgi:hypothetical protein